MDHAVGLDREIRAISGDAEVTDRRAPPYAVGIVQRRRPHTGRAGSVVVRALRKAVGSCRFVECPLVRVPFIRLEPPHNDWAIRSVEIAGEIGVSLHHTEKGHQLLKTPLAIPPRRPIVVVLRHSPQKYLPIHRARTANDLAPRYDARSRLIRVTRYERPVMIFQRLIPRLDVVTVPVFHRFRDVIELLVIGTRLDK